MPALHWRRVRLLAAAATVTALAVPPGSAAQAAPASAAAPAATAASPTPGAAGFGDRLFPRLGNGGYSVGSYELTLRYPTKDPKQAITGSLRMVAKTTQALSRFDLDYAGRPLRSVLVNGRAAAFRQVGEELVVTPRYPLARGRVFTVTIPRLTGRPARLDPRAPVAQPLVYTSAGTFLLARPDGMHRLIPVDDHPRSKAVYRITLDVPAGWTGVASGTLTKRQSGKGRVQSTYTTNWTASSVLQIAAGDLTVVQRPGVDGVPVRDVVPRGLASALTTQLAVERSQFDWLRRQLIAYQSETYGSLVVDAAAPGLVAGTKTLSVVDRRILGSTPAGLRNAVLLRGGAEQWFGITASPRSWSDTWLGDGYATWFEVMYAAENGWMKDAFRVSSVNSLFEGVYRQGDRWRSQWGPVARPVRARPVSDLFSPNVSLGGALVLYALRQEIGDAAFAQLAPAWLASHAGGSGSTDEFIAVASQVAGKDLRTFLIAWLYGSRTPPMPGHPDWTVDPVPA